MTYQELEKKIGKQIEAEWRQSKGGGWIHKSAKVDIEENISKNAIVWGHVSGNARVSGNAQVSGNAHVSGNARVYGDARVSGNAQVSGNAWVSGDARVSGNAQVSGNARVSGDARVSGNARVYGDARVSGNAWVYGDAWVKPVLFLIDSRGHGCTNCKHGWLKIGCEEHTFADWKGRFPAIARKHNLTEAEIVEYSEIIKLFCKIGK